jgi:hypothetical protein
MGQKQKLSDFGLLISGFGLVVGSFGAWISVLVVTISGTAGPRGYLTLASGVLVMVFAASRLWPNLLVDQVTSKLALLSAGALAVSFVVLIEVAVRIRQVSGQADQLVEDSSTPEMTVPLLGGFSQAIDEFTSSLAEAFRPRLAMGWYVCLISVLAASVLMFIQFRAMKRSKSDAVAE